MTSVVFLGTSAAVPSVERGFSCIGIVDGEEGILLDCGDGATRNVLRFGPDVRKITSVLITHLHSDHLSGLAQLLETMAIRRRTRQLNVYGPPGLKEYYSVVQRITNVAFTKTFDLKIEELHPNQGLTLSNCELKTFQMDHTLPCLGYRVESGGEVVSFTGDTQPCQATVELGRDARLFIHEATYLQKDLEKARYVKHSTAKEASEAAKLAKPGILMLTHVNESYEKPEEMMNEASQSFRNVMVAYDGLNIEL